ncbi:MAG: hypothetical protein WCB27_13070 [Thermoguttaceae bacterium]
MSTSIPISARLALLCGLVAPLVFLCASESPAAAAKFLGPDAIVASKDGKTLYVTCKDSNELVAVDVGGRKVVCKTALPAEPTGIALNPEGNRLYVTCSGGAAALCVVETASCRVVATMPAGIMAIAPVVTPDGKRLYVCNRFENKITAIDLGSGKPVASAPAPREPYSAAVTPDGKSLFAADLIPHDPADSGDVAAAITAVDTATIRPSIIRLPNGSIDVRGLCVSPDGRYVYAVHVLARYQLPTTLLDRGWVNTNALSVIDARAKRLINTVLLDDVFRGAANPWSVASTPDGKQICVTHAGTHELSVIDAPGLSEKLAKFGNLPSPSAANVPNDLAFLGDLRRRVKLEGNGPHGVAIIGSNAYVAEYFSDAVAIVDLRANPPRTAGRILLGPKPTIDAKRRGEMLFNDATISFQHWQSCASCHPDGRTDGLYWDLPNDGLGNPKKARSLVGAFARGAAMSLGVRASAGEAVRAGLRYVMMAARPEEDAEAIDEYIRSLTPVPSPRLIDGKLSPAAERGEKIFFDRRVGCTRCHPAPQFTDKRAHDVGSAGPLDNPGDWFQTPSLVELWRTAPYMHDGRYRTVKEIFTQDKHGAIYGSFSRLSDRDIDDMVEFLLSL